RTWWRTRSPRSSGLAAAGSALPPVLPSGRATSPREEPEAGRPVAPLHVRELPSQNIDASMPDPIHSRRTVTGRYAVTEQAHTGPDPDRNLALELVRATEAAAIGGAAATGPCGRGGGA